MEGATHFIEVYRTCKKLRNSDLTQIKFLTANLEGTKWVGFKTVAIWYIKPKPQC